MEWDQFAAGWDQQPGVQEYAAAAFESLQHVAARRGVELAGTRTCDFGCGTGLLTERLVSLSHAIDAVDASPRMLEALDRKRSQHEWSNVRLATTVPDDARYDLIVCSSALAFVDDYAATTQLLVSRLEPGGLFVQWDWELEPATHDPGAGDETRAETGDGTAGEPADGTTGETDDEATHETDDDNEDHGGGIGFTREVVAATLSAAGLADVAVDTAFAVTLGTETMAPLIGVGQRPS